MRRPRHLSQDEKALWDQIARHATPLTTRRRLAVEVPAPLRPMPRTDEAPPVEPILPFQLGQKVDHRRGHDLLASLPVRLQQAPLQMDAGAFGKLKRGKLVPEGRIDLHGMTLSEAHPALIGFILSSQAANRRLVLVITGKGKVRDDFDPVPARFGVLRHQVPQWLSLPPIGQLVMQVIPAHLKHGGHGAYYVYMRRRR